jgi:hypothetical protein
VELSESHAYQIAEDAVTKICQRLARRLNAEAKQAGQEQRITASDLEDLYYKQRGRCAICGVPVEDHGGLFRPKAIQLDHIENVNRRSTFAARADGRESAGAPMADISNVQWVCRLCNNVKQMLVASNRQWDEYISECHRQSLAGFPLRTNADVCGSRASKRGKRLAWMREQFDKHGHSLSSHNVARHFAGTELEVNYATHIKELKEMGWCGQRHAAELRRQIASNLSEAACLAENIAIGSAAKKTLKEWHAEMNALAYQQHGLPPIGSQGWRVIVDELSLFFPVSGARGSRAELRMASASERSWILSELSAAGDSGMTAEELSARTCSDTFVEELKANAIKSLVASGRIERHCERLYYGLTRTEAAEVVGVSRNRLKKWAVLGVGPRFMKIATNSKGECYYSARTLYEFAEKRKKTTFDRVGWQNVQTTRSESIF